MAQSDNQPTPTPKVEILINGKPSPILDLPRKVEDFQRVIHQKYGCDVTKRYAVDFIAFMEALAEAKVI